jgi:hypothetical protein
VAAVFPRLTPALEFADLGADYGADAESYVAGTIARKIAGTIVDRPRSGGFQDQARMGLFILPCGVFWASGTCGSVLGYHGRPLCFHGLSLILGFVFPLNLDAVHSACGGRVWQVAPVFPLCGGPLVLLKSPASLPQICQVEGISQVSFPYQGRYSPATRPVTLEDYGDDGGVDGTMDQVQFGCFGLRPGVSRASFGLLSREGCSSGVPRVSPWPPLGAWGPPAPLGGRGWSSFFPFLT